MKNYFLSKNYKDTASAGNKAKTDIEQILIGLGYENAGLRQTHYSNSVVSFLLTLTGVFKVFFSVSPGSVLVLQYPLKKYFTFVCRMAHWRGCKVVTIIHDLGAFRRKKLTVAQEIKRLGFSDYLIVHNRFMKQWLTDNGYRNPMGCLEIFDYLSETEASPRPPKQSNSYQVIYAGGLSYKKNRFLYEMDLVICTWNFHLYGGGFELERIQNKDHFVYKGFVPSDRLIATAEGDFGLVWDGVSPTTCSGTFGEYLQYNNPHKTSLYIRCHLPVIVWSKAAMAAFVREHQIGLCIDSLEELNERLPLVTKTEYAAMQSNVIAISQKLTSGYFVTKALSDVGRLMSGSAIG